jgi:hypothetical protein
MMSMLNWLRRRGSEVADPAHVERTGYNLDPTPPPDHENFVELRSAGLRAVRENLARRRKKR